MNRLSLTLVRNTVIGKVLIAILAVSFISTGCASRTIIKSRPDGATVFIDDIQRGITPYRHRDVKVLGSTRRVRLQKEGYMPTEALIVKDEFRAKNCIGGCFFMPLLLWSQGYPAEYEFELKKAGTKRVPTEKRKGGDLLNPGNP
jgi:hypothetical protein